MILVCGESLYDFVPTADGFYRPLIGGSPLNVAVGLARLGVKVSFASPISKDSLGQAIITYLLQQGVNGDSIIAVDQPSTLSVVTMEQGQPHYSFYEMDGVAHLPKPPSLFVGDDTSLIHFGSYALALPSTGSLFLELAQRYRHLFIALDPNIRPTVIGDMAIWQRQIARFTDLAHLVKISDEDRHYCYPDWTRPQLADYFLSRASEMVVITDGAGPLEIWRKGRQHPLILTPPTILLADSVGAGDSLQATMLAQIHTLANEGATSPKQAALNAIAFLREASDELLIALVTKAMIAAALTCARQGAELPDWSLINAFQQPQTL